MTTRFSAPLEFSGSAKIYQFPPRGRYAENAQRDVAGSTVAASLPAGAKIVSGSGWYHEEAIQEARKSEQSRKN